MSDKDTFKIAAVVFASLSVMLLSITFGAWLVTRDGCAVQDWIKMENSVPNEILRK